jgi:magnesium-transporting ATPase (P-type)
LPSRAAENAAEALQSMLAAKSMVIRDGQQRMVPCDEIVVGDVLYLQAGDGASLVAIFLFAAARLRAD